MESGVDPGVVAETGIESLSEIGVLKPLGISREAEAPTHRSYQ